MKLVAPNRGTTLLARILEQPELVARVRALGPGALARLIDHVGLEDAGEIVALATPEQLLGVFDEDLWTSDRAGEGERFDAARFATWLEVLAEAGERELADKVVELPEELVVHGLAERLLVLDLDVLALEMAGWRQPAVDLTDKALESCLSLELDGYLVIALEHDGWDAITTLLAELNERHRDDLVRVLDRLAALASGRIEDQGGLYDVLSAAETLATDVAAEREDRRARLGHVAPADAVAFLRLTMETSPERLAAAREPDPLTRAYFREYVPATAEPGRPGELEVLLREVGLEEPSAARLPAPAGAAGRFRAGLLALQEREPELHAARMAELAYLANALAAGATIEGRRYRPAEAAEAALGLCADGLEHLLDAAPGDGDRADRARRLIERESAVKLFRLGYRLIR
jgi:hypothetical protein